MPPLWAVAVFLLVGIIPFNLAEWYGFFVATRTPPGTGIVVVITVVAVACILAVIIFRKQQIWLLAIFVFFSLSVLTVSFSSLYWRYGQYGNFNFQLSRFDAIYFTIGTLGTGTGNIFAISETARAIQLAQMGVDFGFILLAVGIFVSRLTAGGESRRTETNASVADEIKKFADLHAARILTDAEFAAKKTQLLDSKRLGNGL